MLLEHSKTKTIVETDGASSRSYSVLLEQKINNNTQTSAIPNRNTIKENTINDVGENQIDSENQSDGVKRPSSKQSSSKPRPHSLTRSELTLNILFF